MAEWKLVVPDETDQVVRKFLKNNAEETGNLAEFVDHAVSRRVFEMTVAKIKKRSAHYDQEELQKIIDEEVAAVRKSCS